VINKAAISVVIPCFNSATTIERALRSVEHQTTKPHEVLVVDDASSDNSVSIIEQYARTSSLSIRVIKQNVNGGPSVARNAAWNVAAGEFIAFLDADDQWHPKKMEIQIAAFELTPDASMCTTGYVFNSQPSHWDEIVDSDITYQRNSFWKYVIANRSATPTVMFRNTVSLRFPTDQRHAEDYYLWLLSSKLLGPTVHINQVLTFCSNPAYGGKGQSGQFLAMQKAELSGFRKLKRMGHLSTFEHLIVASWSCTKFVIRMIDAKLFSFRKRP
jgi:glycosyltransferase involved in cell wall biosynthesis